MKNSFATELKVKAIKSQSTNGEKIWQIKYLWDWHTEYVKNSCNSTIKGQITQWIMKKAIDFFHIKLVSCNYAIKICSFWESVNSLGFSPSTITSRRTMGFISSFSICILLFGCFIVLPMISSKILNKSGKTGHPSLIPYLRERACSFSP